MNPILFQAKNREKINRMQDDSKSFYWKGKTIFSYSDKLKTMR